MRIECHPPYKGQSLTSRSELSDFLASVERRAFRQALYALRNEETALDAVQDAMMKLAEKYGHLSAEQWPMLFQRILQNAIRDIMRRARVRSLWTSLFSSFSHDDEVEADFVESIESHDRLSFASPHARLEQTQIFQMIEEEIKKLPARQREAFLLRYWEELDIAETASVMGCSEGSVKTHCSRATHTLAAALKEKGVSL